MEDIVVGELYYDFAFNSKPIVLCISKTTLEDIHHNTYYVCKFYNTKTKIIYTINRYYKSPYFVLVV
jgi:hypothetical protein